MLDFIGRGADNPLVLVLDQRRLRTGPIRHPDVEAVLQHDAPGSRQVAGPTLGHVVAFRIRTQSQGIVDRERRLELVAAVAGDLDNVSESYGESRLFVPIS